MAEQSQLGTVKMRLPSGVKKGDVIEVKVKIKHPSRTGLGVVEDAKTPFERFVRRERAIYLTRVEVYYGDERVSVFDLNPSTSDDPLLAFKLRADREAPVRVVFTSSEGKTYEVKERIAFG